ncbi:MAG: atpC [Rhizobacter sp.]|nr:atpC [Rhizobacter sp.]
MKLRIVTPSAVVVEDDKVTSVRAEDASGSFGILAGHADFLTSLSICVISWSGTEGKRRYCAVRRGVLWVAAGQRIEVATREAVVGADLATLDEDVLARFRADLDTQRTEHVAGARLQLNAIRQLVRNLSAQGSGSGGDYT